MAECLQIAQHKKDESNENYDYEEFCENFTYLETTTCYICNGYYAPNFGEPLCGTCHAFLFPVIEEKRSTDLSDNDEDSGNDEPPYRDSNASVEYVLRSARPVSVAFRSNEEVVEQEEENIEVLVSTEIIETVAPALRNDRFAICEGAFLGHRPEPEPPRNLRQYINELTETDEINKQIKQHRVEKKADNADTSLKLKADDTISALPVEVLLVIFSYLDDISLCHSAEVCKQWKSIVEAHTPQSLWQRYTKARWPLYHQITHTTNWFKIYSSLMSSCFCRTCVIQMTLRVPNQQENRFRATRLRGDIRTLMVDATEGIEAVPLDDQLTRWQASIIGPAGSPYEGGKFFLHIQIPYNYPMNPPVVRFLTKIIHPNVSRHGDVGIDIIQHNWSLVLTISKLLLSVQSLLTDPFTDVCMEPIIGRLYDEDRLRFEALARRWTWKYAMLEVIPC